MSENDFSKIVSYMQMYRDLYGKEVFIDPERLQEKVNELPDFKPVKETPPATGVSSAKAENQQPNKPDLRPDQSQSEDSPLWQYKKEIENCQKCPLGKTRTKFVFGDGNENADIMFVGEAPGADEDRTGIPFVGRAGQLLNKLLKRINLNRGDVFIANILKSRPPNNRDPLPEEVAACIPYLHRQIELIQPKLLVALGRIAAQNLLQTTSSLRDMRGRVWRYQGVPLIVTYHPAALLRNNNLLDAALEDLRFIVQTSRDQQD
jgi:uracil-DNA glycosylase family 4